MTAFRRLLCAAGLLLAATPLAAQPAPSQLGSGGEVYSVQRGTYKALFPAPPPAWANHPVLALDIVRDGKLQRVLVPGTDGPQEERAPALALDHDSSRGWLVWASDRTINLIGFSAAGWSEVFAVAGDPGSDKLNPQVAATVDRYQRLDGEGELVWASLTVLHLVWFDDGPAGQRVLYTPLAIRDGEILGGNRLFDLQELSGGEPASGAAVAAARVDLLQRPLVVGSRDGGHVVVAFLSPASGELVTLELRPIGGELAFFGDLARAVVIDTGHRDPGATPASIAEEARAVVIDTGRRLLRASLANLLGEQFLADVGAAPSGGELAEVTDAARARLIAEGVALMQGTAGPEIEFLEIAGGGELVGDSHLLDVRRASRRALPDLPAAAVRLLVSDHGDQASLAWSVDGAVRYRETAGAGWSELRSLALGAALDTEQALRLLQQRLAGR